MLTNIYRVRTIRQTIPFRCLITSAKTNASKTFVSAKPVIIQKAKKKKTRPRNTQTLNSAFCSLYFLCNNRVSTHVNKIRQKRGNACFTLPKWSVSYYHCDFGNPAESNCHSLSTDLQEYWVSTISQDLQIPGIESPSLHWQADFFTAWAYQREAALFHRPKGGGFHTSEMTPHIWNLEHEIKALAGPSHWQLFHAIRLSHGDNGPPHCPPLRTLIQSLQDTISHWNCIYHFQMTSF